MGANSTHREGDHPVVKTNVHRIGKKVTSIKWKSIENFSSCYITVSELISSCYIHCMTVNYNCRQEKAAADMPRWLCSLVVRVLESRLDGRGSIPGCREKYWNGWPSSGGQTTLVFHQATHANSASYPQQDGKWIPAKNVVTPCG